MEYNELKNYFDDYIKQYFPYKNSNVFQSLANFISEKYLKNLYQDIPATFKSLYENSTILTSVYDQLLVAIGLPSKIINKLNFSEKIIFLKSMSDFQKYKGTVLFFQNVSKSFADKFDIYELYADRLAGEWILKPELIYKGSGLDSEIHSLNYETVYNKVPTLLVSEQQLDSLKDNNDTRFPIKTNLILLDYNLNSSVNTMIGLIISTILKEYGSSTIPIYFQNENFEFTLKEIYYIWYYILTRHYKTKWLKFDLRRIINYDSDINPYNMSELDNLMAEYESISSVVEAEKFYNENIAIHFSEMYYTKEQTISDMEVIIKNISSEFFNYFENRLNDLSGDTLIRETDDILTEIFNSLILFYRDNSSDILFFKYFETFLYTLSHIILDPEQSTSYIILSNLKPFHTELITQYESSIVCDDKFNIVTPEIDYSFLIEILFIDFIGDMNDLGIFGFDFPVMSHFEIESSSNYDFKLNKELLTNLEERVLYYIEKFDNSILEITQQFLFDIKFQSLTAQDIVESINYNFKLNNEYSINLEEQSLHSIENSDCSILETSQQFLFESSHQSLTSQDIIEIVNYNCVLKDSNLNIEFNDNSLFNMVNNLFEVNNLLDRGCQHTEIFKHINLGLISIVMSNIHVNNIESPQLQTNINFNQYHKTLTNLNMDIKSTRLVEYMVGDIGLGIILASMSNIDINNIEDIQSQININFNQCHKTLTNLNMDIKSTRLIEYTVGDNIAMVDSFDVIGPS